MTITKLALTIGISLSLSSVIQCRLSGEMGTEASIEAMQKWKEIQKNDKTSKERIKQLLATPLAEREKLTRAWFDQDRQKYHQESRLIARKKDTLPSSALGK